MSKIEFITSPTLPANAPLKARIIAALQEVYDPELPVNLYDLGLIYEITEEDGDGHIHITMTLTAPNCPVADLIPQMVHKAVVAVEGVQQVDVNLVWEPKWTRDMMSEAAKIECGWL